MELKPVLKEIFRAKTDAKQNKGMVVHQGKNPPSEISFPPGVRLKTCS